MQINKDKYSADYLLRHSGYERWAYKQFLNALNEQVSPVIDHVKLFGGITDTLSDMLVTRKPMESAYLSVYVKVGSMSAKSTREWINRTAKKGLLSFLSEKWRELMRSFYERESATRVTEVTDTTRDRIRRVLADSQDLPISQQATYIVDTLSDPDFNRNRALVIARTESTTAANQGAELGAADADYLTVKSWLAIEDKNTRRTHMIADGQQADENGLFEVGGFKCRYPGDLNLPAQEVVQCRCTVVYEPLEDEDGLPVLR